MNVYSKFLYETIDYTFTRVENVDIDKSFLKIEHGISSRYLPILISKYGNDWNTLIFQYETYQAYILIEKDKDDNLTAYAGKREVISAFDLFLETLIQN